MIDIRDSPARLACAPLTYYTAEAASGESGAGAAGAAGVGRCRLDPSLKAHSVSKFDCEKDNRAFNLNLVAEIVPLHRGDGRATLGGRSDGVRPVATGSRCEHGWVIEDSEL